MTAPVEPIAPGKPQDGMLRRPRRSVRIAAVAVMLLMTVVGVELTARLAYTYRHRLTAIFPASMTLQDYQLADERHPHHWRLRPGFVQTFQEALEAKKRARRVVGEEVITDTMQRRNISGDDVFLRINSDGFRGPEIDKTHSRFRILTIGDSCTFGSSETHNYSRALERHLANLGRDAEVINGGVEGYAPRNVLFRIDELAALRPQIVTVYLGWNALWSNVGPFYSVQLLKQAFALAKRRFDPQSVALDAYQRPKRPDATAANLKSLDDYVPPFLPEVETIVERLANEGIRVVLLTLPGLFVPEETPTARALEIGHLPEFTDNPYFFAKMAAKYNERLRDLARRKHVELIDLEAWSRTALQPRDSYFFDSVHMYDHGQELIGAYMAEQLQQLIPERHTSQP